MRNKFDIRVIKKKFSESVTNDELCAAFKEEVKQHGLGIFETTCLFLRDIMGDEDVEVDFLSIGQKRLRSRMIVSEYIKAHNEKFPDELLNFSDMDLRFVDMSNLNLRKAYFALSKIGHCSFKFSDLTDANFLGADVYRADFKGTCLYKADFEAATGGENNFADAIALGCKNLPQDWRGGEYGCSMGINALLSDIKNKDHSKLTSDDLRNAGFLYAIFQDIGARCMKKVDNQPEVKDKKHNVNFWRVAVNGGKNIENSGNLKAAEADYDAAYKAAYSRYEKPLQKLQDAQCNLAFKFPFSVYTFSPQKMSKDMIVRVNAEKDGVKFRNFDGLALLGQAARDGNSGLNHLPKDVLTIVGAHLLTHEADNKISRTNTYEFDIAKGVAAEIIKGGKGVAVSGFAKEVVANAKVAMSNSEKLAIERLKNDGCYYGRDV